MKMNLLNLLEEHKASGLGLLGLGTGYLLGGTAGVCIPPIAGYQIGDYLSKLTELNPWLQFAIPFTGATMGALISPHSGKIGMLLAGYTGLYAGAASSAILSLPGKTIDRLCSARN